MLTRSNTSPVPSLFLAQTGCSNGWNESAQQSKGWRACGGPASGFLWRVRSERDRQGVSMKRTVRSQKTRQCVDLRKRQCVPSGSRRVCLCSCPWWLIVLKRGRKMSITSERRLLHCCLHRPTERVGVYMRLSVVCLTDYFWCAIGNACATRDTSRFVLGLPSTQSSPPECLRFRHPKSATSSPSSPSSRPSCPHNPKAVE